MVSADTSADKMRALVTGAGKRVGKAIALGLAEQGACVALHYGRSKQEAEATREEILRRGGHAVLVQGNLESVQETEHVVDEAAQLLGGLTLLVGSAANFDRVAFDELTMDHWRRAMDVNLTANYVLATRAAPHLRKTSGSIVFVTCCSTVTPMRNYLPYVVSKAALQQLTRVLALELAPNVRVNAVAPGTVLPPADMDASAVQALVSRAPAGRVGSAEDIAKAVVYLSGASFVTGEQLVVDGGRSVAGFERFG